jgi:DNA repair photolyase
MTRPESSPRKGRGAIENSEGRFEPLRHETFDDGWGTGDERPPAIKTLIREDHARSIIARNDSPDLPFDQSVNPYRGCEHGCIYCYARPSHAYLGLSPGLDFESRLFYKPDAAALLKRELAAPGYRCRALALGTNTDPYQPIERELRLMRSILEVLHETNHPVCITTKSSLIERDRDLLGEMAQRNLVQVGISITTLDHALARKMEPRACAPRRRLETIARLAEAGIPVRVMVAPVIPVLTDPEMEGILDAAARAGASHAGYTALRLPGEVAELFRTWLEAHFPLKAAHVMSVVRQTRGGRDNDATFGRRMRGSGEFADLTARRFAIAIRRLGFADDDVEFDTTLFRRPGTDTAQPDLFTS